MVEYRPLKAELLLKQSSSSGAHLDWNVRKVCVWFISKKWLAQSRGALNINKSVQVEVSLLQLHLSFA